MEEFKLPRTLKASYVLALILMVVGMVSTSDVTVATAVIVLCVLSVGTYILESIHELKAAK